MKLSLVVLLVSVTCALAHVRRGLSEESGAIGGGHCTTKVPEHEDYEAQKRAQTFANFRKERKGTAYKELSEATRVITVCFHNPQYRFSFLNRLRSDRQVSTEELQRELDHLNEAFSSASCCDTSLDWCNGECSVDIPIKFVMAKIDGNQNVIGTVNSTSAAGACVTRPRGRHFMRMSVIGFRQILIKRRLRVGGANTLNVYYIRAGLLPGFGGKLLGFSTFPWEYSKRKKKDGVVIEPKSIVGGSAPYNEGDTLVHEVGHWLGLFHTFEGGCDGSGDTISDTPAEKTSHLGCNPSENRDSCPNDGQGPDDVFNFLGYEDDACLFRFTPEQAAAMVENVDAYRSGGLIEADSSILARESAALRSSSDSLESYSITAGSTRVFSYNVPDPAFVSCSMVTTDGDLDLFVNWDGGFEHFDCSEESQATEKVCAVGKGSGTVYAFVYAATSSSDFFVTCSTN